MTGDSYNSNGQVSLDSRMENGSRLLNQASNTSCSGPREIEEIAQRERLRAEEMIQNEVSVQHWLIYIAALHNCELEWP
jgi:hypothetical protein